MLCVFAFSSAKRIFTALAYVAHRGLAFAEITLETLYWRSPSSVAIALVEMQLGATLDLAGALKLDYCIAARILWSYDFCEGVRVTLVDKGGIPDWCPVIIYDVRAEDIDAYFVLLGDEELMLLAGLK